MEKVNLKNNKAITLICSMLLVFMMSLAIGINADAAQKQSVKLPIFSSTTSYDLDGDGSKDSLYISSTMYGGVVSINRGYYDESYIINWGKSIVAWETDFYLYTLSNGNRYIGAYATGEYDEQLVHVIYRYTPGSLVKSLDVDRSLTNSLRGMEYTSEQVKVSGNTITVKYDTGLTATARYKFNVKYKPSSNKLKPTDTKYKVTVTKSGSKSFKVLKKFKTYKKVGSKKVSYTTKVGEKLKVVKICPKSKNAYVLLKRTSGKTGWVNFKKLSSYLR